MYVYMYIYDQLLPMYQQSCVSMYVYVKECLLQDNVYHDGGMTVCWDLKRPNTAVLPCETFEKYVWLSWQV